MSVTPPRASLLLLAYLAFVSLGLPDGLIGVDWPSIRADLGVPTEAVGLVLTAGTVGYLTSSVLAGFTLARLGVGRLLAGSTVLASLALTGYASTPELALMIGCALVLGLGSGAVDSGLNALFHAQHGGNPRPSGQGERQWGSLFAWGRVVQGVAAERLGVGRVLRGSLLGMTAGALLIALPAPAWVALAGLVLVGFAAAPVYPLLTLATPERVGAAHADRAIGVQIGTAGLGAALIPGGLGVLFGHTSVALLGPALTVPAVLLLLLHALAGRRPGAATG
ncbi:MFS transporter [Micromonospora sp. L31]|uniref:MFS transporter n=1 Tax=Micromonospora TaxID=1873 RepID=UPI003F8AA03D